MALTGGIVVGDMYKSGRFFNAEDSDLEMLSSFRIGA
jgi:hypothetical protein